MSTALPTKPRRVSKQSQITLVVSRYNEKFTQAMVENTREELTDIMPNTLVEVLYVSGAFEIPVAVSAVLRQDNVSAVIALGLIIQGETKHGDLIAESVTSGLQSLAIKHTKPVIHEVLLVENEKQAYARCIGSQLNRGKEAARAAAVMVELFAQIETQGPASTKPTQRQYPSNV